MLTRNCSLFLLLVLPGLYAVPVGAQPATNEARLTIEQEILQMDSCLFSAFNRRDAEAVAQFFTKDLEFYHDQGGLANYEENLAATQDLFARDYVLHRRLLAGSSEVHAIKDYGAVQTGRHEFCHEENGRLDCGTFKFVHLWQKQSDGSWKISRVISYDH